MSAGSNPAALSAWTGRCSNPGIAWIGVGASTLTFVLAVTLRDESPAWVTTMTILLAAGILVALVIASRLVVAIDSREFAVRWGPTGWPVRRIPWGEVVALTTVQVDPWTWGGWGYRWLPGRRATAAVVRRGPGIQLDLRDGRHFLVTVPDADAAVASGLRFLG